MISRLDPDPAGGGGGGNGDKPPVADKIVKSPEVKESDAAEIVKLRNEISDRDKKLKDRESRINELEDENRVLKNPPTPKPQPAPEKKKFMEGQSGFGFFI